MSAERRKILDLLATGKITPEDAERLLDKLAEPSASRTGGETGGESTPRAPEKRRYLRVLVDDPERDRVNMRVPLAFVRSGMALVGILPVGVTEGLAAKGLDLSGLCELQGAKLDEALNDLNVDIDGSTGRKVRIFCE